MDLFHTLHITKHKRKNKMSYQELYFTKKGLAKLDDDIREMELRLRGLREARKNGDEQQHENASHEHSLVEINGINWRLGEACNLHGQAILVGEPTNTDLIAIGTKVKVRIVNGPAVEWKIAGYGESDPDNGIIAYNTPLAA